MLKRDPHLAILLASEAGRGLHLSADEVQYLICDDAIVTRAEAVRMGEARYPDLPELNELMRKQGKNA